MSTDDMFSAHSAFATDWLAQSDPRAFDGSASGPDSSSFDHQDSLGFLTGNAFGGFDGLAGGGGTKGTGMLTQDELARALMGGIDGGGGGAARMGDLSSAGTSTTGARSDAGSSPYSSSMSQYGGAHHPSSSSSSAQFDFAAESAALANSPPFSLPHNLSCDFDTAALQSLFTNSSPTTTAGPGINAHLSPYPSAPTYPPLQTRSPASSVSPYTASVSTFPQHHQQQPQPIDIRGMSGFNPAQLFASTSAAASGASPSAPRLSVDYTSPLSTFSSFSAPGAAQAPVAVAPQPHAHAHHPHQPLAQQQQQQPAFTSLAATAGIAVPSLHAGPSAQSGLYGFSGATHDPSTLGGGARGRATRTRTQAPVGETGEAESEQRGRSPMEVIANAGLQSAMHPAPLLQLNPNVNLPGLNRNSARKGEDGEAEHEQKPAAGKSGKKGKKVDRGHNAVEQKYRNSINNALASLRDTIPALHHLKPLPSMPVSKRKASQFTLASAAIPETPTGLVDGVTPAKTLSKGVILNKANEYIDYLRFARESRDADIELLKTMVRDMVGGGDALVAEFERRREVLEVTRAEEREQRARDEQDEDGSGGDEEDDEDEAPAPAAKAPKAALTAGTKRGRKADAPSAAAAPAKKARGRGGAAVASSASGLSPPLTGEYRHVQAHNQAHLDSLAGGAQNVFPPSPLSSGDELSVSPGAVMGQHGAASANGRVLLASFMGVSFAGGLGYDLVGSAVVAEESIGAAAARVLTGRIVRRSGAGNATDFPLEVTLADRLHPSLVSGLVALGAATFLATVVYLVLPLFSRRSSPPVAAAEPSPRARRRAQAVAALTALSTTSSTADSSYASGRASALAARRELLRIVDAPGPLGLPVALAKEALVWVARRVTGLTWSKDGAGPSEEDVEEAVAWVRVAEIEATVGDRLARPARLYTFLRLCNLSRSPAWPQVSPSTTHSAVDALLAIHLLSLGHARWAEARWQRMAARRKKVDAPEGDSFVDLALTSEWATVAGLLAPESRSVKQADEASASSDTVPLLVVAEDACHDAMKDAWSTIFVAVAGSTASSSSSPPTAEAAAESLASLADADETAGVVYRAMPEGTDLRNLALVTKVFLSCYRAGTYPSTSSSLPSSSPSSTAGDLAEARTLLAQLVLGSKDALSRLACAAPLLRLIAPALTGPISTALSTFLTSPTEHPSSDVDLLATVTLSWLLVRRQGAYVEPTTSSGDNDDVKVALKPNPALHAETLSLRRLLGSDLCQAREHEHDADELVEDDEVVSRVEDAKELLVDALTGISRRAAGLASMLDEDSGVELEA
ncbi:hypothetical protein JCM3775_003260 [Rhodotorula graminis]